MKKQPVAWRERRYLMSKMYNKVKDFYDKGLWPINRVKNAVVKGWITAGEYELITGEKYEE